MIEITLFQGLTLAIALVGAVLGIINTWHGLDKTRVKLLVQPKHAMPVGAADPRFTFCIEVVNLSAFPVTVYDVGVLYRGTEDRGSFVRPFLMDGGKWPRRLEPRSTVTVYGQRPSSHGHGIKCAYANTECGHMQTGTSPALKQIAREAAQNESQAT